MSRLGGAREGDDVVRGASVQAAKGAGLVLLAVIIGIVLLQVVDDGTAAPKNAVAPKVVTSTTHRKNTTKTTKPTSTTKATVRPTRAPSQVRVIALNAGGPTGSAKNMRLALLQKGYSNQPEANTWNGAGLKGNTVFCKPGFEQEAAALVVAVGGNAKVKPFPATPPPFSANVDCVVAVGAP